MREGPIHAVSVDTASIQRYVFASNKLKENIGASYIIEEWLYKEVMITSIREASGETAPDLLSEWQPCKAPIALQEDTRKAEIGYIGGGNALILFAEHQAASDFVTHFSRAVLLYFPGIRVVYGRTEAGLEDLENKEAFKAFRERLNQDQQKCKNGYYAPPILYKPGIVTDCPSSNEAAEFPYTEPDKPRGSKRWLSASTKAKLEAAEKAFDQVQETYVTELKGEYLLTNEIDKLGHQQDKGYVAIVHADGNGIGNKFREVENLKALRKLSVQVSGIAAGVMKKLIAHAVEVVEVEAGLPRKDREFQLHKFVSREEDSELRKSWHKKREFLPIRPILAAGDDITFVCEGRLGVYFAAKIMEYFEENQIGDLTVTACAGVAICKTHYPFFKAYSLAEELIHQSKVAAKLKENRGDDDAIASWFHFLALPSGFNGDLEDVLESQFSTHGKPLLSGPYRLKGDNSLDTLLALKGHYLEGKKYGTQSTKVPVWPRSKIMEMREAFRLDSITQTLFVKQAEARGLYLHEDQDTLFSAGEDSPQHLIYDMIELIDFYPQKLPQPCNSPSV